MEVEKQMEKIEQFKPLLEDRNINNLVEDNINRFNDDSVKNFTRAIINNSGSGNVIFYDDKKKPDDSSAIKITKMGVVVNLMLLLSVFLNM
jgi:hypothetical protein